VKYTKAESVGVPFKNSELVRGLSFALVSAIPGAQSELQAKCLAEIVWTSVEGDNQM
jgi:hypothetical protein